MKTRNIVYGLLCLLVLGCGQAHHEMKEEIQSRADSVSVEPLASSAAEEVRDTSRKFIRTADLRFKVKNVIKSAYAIEDVIRKHGGFITLTNMSSNIDYVDSKPVSADTTLESTYYTVTNSMTIRVPNTKLDTTLKEIALWVDFLDYRTIKADDVALQILSNKLTQKRSFNTGSRLINAIDNRGKKLGETTAAEDILAGKELEADNAIVANKSLMDQVNYSTVSISLYQRQSVKRELIPNDKNIDIYEPGLASKTWDSVKYGWSILEGVYLFIVKMWGLFFIGAIIYFLFKTYGNRFKK